LYRSRVKVRSWSVAQFHAILGVNLGALSSVASWTSTGILDQELCLIQTHDCWVSGVEAWLIDEGKLVDEGDIGCPVVIQEHGVGCCRSWIQVDTRNVCLNNVASVSPFRGIVVHIKWTTLCCIWGSIWVVIAPNPLKVDPIPSIDSQNWRHKVGLDRGVDIDNVSSLSSDIEVVEAGGSGDVGWALLDCKDIASILKGSPILVSVDLELDWRHVSKVHNGISGDWRVLEAIVGVIRVP